MPGFMTAKGHLVRSVMFPHKLDLEFFRNYLKTLPFFLLLGLAAVAYTAYTWHVKAGVSMANT
jgi:hypothetical protein